MATRLVHAPKVTNDPYGAVSPPLYQTATYEQVSSWKDVLEGGVPSHPVTWRRQTNICMQTNFVDITSEV